MLLWLCFTVYKLKTKRGAFTVEILCKIELTPCPHIATHHDCSYILSLTQEVFDDEKQFLKCVVVL